MRGHIPNIQINCVHHLNEKLSTCDGFGRSQSEWGYFTNNLDFTYYYIDHYNFKSTEEFINKINKGDVLYFKDNKMARIQTYFSINKITRLFFRFYNHKYR